MAECQNGFQIFRSTGQLVKQITTPTNQINISDLPTGLYFLKTNLIPNVKMHNNMNYFVGIDVQIRRGCCYYIINQNKKYVTSGWINENIPTTFNNLLSEVSNNQPGSISIGIDAPRMPINKLRTSYYDRKINSWIEKTKQSTGRACEVIIKSYNLANPQWTNTLEDSPQWMRLGYEIFSALSEFPYVYEVFPSAAYKMLEKEKVCFELCVKNFSAGVKDMLDASVAAITVYEFVKGRGCEVGGEDGLGTIVLPRKLIIQPVNKNM